MANKTLNTRIIIRNDTATAWQSANPVLRKGEIGIVFDPSAEVSHITNFKIGDGVTAWNSLPLMITEESVEALAQRVTVLEATAGVAGSVEYKIAQHASDYDAAGAATAAEAAAKQYADDKVAGLSTVYLAASYSNAIAGNTTAIATLNADVAGLQQKVDVNSVTAAIASAQSETLASANTAAQGYVSAGLASLSTVYLAASYSGAIASNADAIATLNATGGVAGSVEYKIGEESTRAKNAEHELEVRIDALEGNHFIIVQTLPATGEANIIYLVPKAPPLTGYKEWLYIKVSTNPDTYSWEEIGDTDIDLSNYYTKSEVNAIATSTLASANAAAQGYVSALSTVYLAASYSSAIAGNTDAIATVGIRVGAIEADYLKQADVLILDCGNATSNYSAS